MTWACGFRLLLIVWLLLTFGMAETAASAAKSKAPSSNEASSGDLALATAGAETQTVQLAPVLTQPGRVAGTLSLLLKNTGSRSGVLRVVYAPANGGAALRVTSDHSASMHWVAPSTEPVLGPGRTQQVTIGFSPQAHETIDTLAGNLFIRLIPSGSGQASRSATRLVVPIKAELAPIRGVSFEPASVTLQITQPGDGGQQATVRLTGPGAQGLTTLTPAFTESVRLGNDSGDQITVTLTDLRVDDNQVIGTIRAEDGVNPGGYKGKLALDQSDHAPTLDLTVDSHVAIWIAIGLVFLSALLGGFLPAATKIGRRRAGALAQFKQMLKDYSDARGDLHHPPPIWNLERDLGPRPWYDARWSAMPQLDQAAGLYGAMHWARTDDDFESVAIAAQKMEDLIRRWLLLIRPAEDLAKGAEQKVQNRGRKHWQARQIYEDSELLLWKLRRTKPKTQDEADELLNDIIAQHDWYEAVRVVWTALAGAQRSDHVPPKKRDQLRRLPLDDLTDPEKPAAEREPPEQDQLFVKLDALISKANGIWPALDLKQSLRAKGGGGASLVSEETISPGQDFTQGVAVQVNKSKEANQGPPSMPGRRKLWAWFEVQDVALTVLLALGAVIAYMVPLYSATWGSVTDLLTALAAGFGTQAIVQWAALPAFQSLRLSSKAEPAPAADGPTEPK
jgi:hypothetical protein